MAKILRTHQRPRPPRALLEDIPGKFIAAPEVEQWFRDVIIDEAGALHNPDHGHLEHASIGMLWTTAGNARRGRRIIGTAEFADEVGGHGKWAKARAHQQIEEWFGFVPDFLITLDAHYCAECSDVEFLALVEHEAYHCAQELDLFGVPKFRKNGKPAFALQGHDVEEFIGVVRRYGATDRNVRALVAAANKGPEVASARIGQACGTCRDRRAA